MKNINQLRKHTTETIQEVKSLLYKFDVAGLLITPSSNIILQAFRAFFVGSMAFFADASFLWILSLTGLHYLICTVFSFFIGVCANYLLSKRFVFKEKATVGKLEEFIAYIIVGTVGLVLTVGFMWFFTEFIGLFFMVSRIATSFLVFIWSFLSRKFALYKGEYR